MLLRLAVRSLLRQRRRTALVMMAVALGTLAVTGVRGFLNGLQRELVRGFAEGQVGAVVVQRQGFADSTDVAPLTPSIHVTPELLRQLEAVQGVRCVAPRIVLPGLVAVGEESTFALVVGVDEAREPCVASKRAELVVEGQWLNGASAVVGLELLRGLRGKLGDTVTVLSNDQDGVMNAVEARVSGKLAAATQGEKKLVLLPLAKARELVRMPDQATEIAVAARNLDDVDALTERVRTALGPGYTVRSWKQVAGFAHELVTTQDKALNVVVMVFLVVILMGLMNAMLASVLERTREIGTMVSLGAKRRMVVMLFVTEAMCIGFVGSLIGVMLGGAIVLALGAQGIDLTTPGSSLPQHLVPFSRPTFLLRMVALGTFGAGLAALYPAWRASRLDPVQALTST
jgi:putative ABC transport system permease protein